MKSFWMGLVVLCCAQNALSQCGPDEVEVTFVIGTDGWGYEMYWEIVPSGAGCGNGTLYSNGNPDVGCFDEGGGTGETYGNNVTITEGPFCMTAGEALDFIYVDSYGDGGMSVSMYIDGVFSGGWNGTGDGNTWTFVVGESLLIDHDTPCDAMPIEVDGAEAIIDNNGASVEPGEPTPGAAPTGSCTLPGYWCGSDGNVSRSVWLSFVATSSSPLDITSCNEGTNFDTQLALYTASNCGDFEGFELIAANDDMSGGCGAANGYSSFLHTSCLVEGETYFLQLDGWAGGQGVAHISISTSDEGAEVGLMAQVRNISCPEDKDSSPDGLIAAYVSEGVSDFDISWTGPNNFASEASTIAGLQPGTYNATATTACGNSFTNTWEITLPQPWSVSTEVIDASCASAANGSAVIDVSGATGPYNLTWNGPGIEDGEGTDLDSLLAGTYQITITDDNDCTYPVTIIVEGASAADFTIGPDSTICADESMLIYAPPGFDYEWQDGSQNQFFYIQPGDFSPGTYSIIVNASDDAGCSFADAMLLTVFNCTTGIGETEGSSPVMFPNPASDFLTFQGLPADAQHQVVDGRGRVIWSADGKTTSIDVSSWAPGMYFWVGATPAGLTWREPLTVR
jgi:hypothetical protein